jgi:hypothetical protein
MSLDDMCTRLLRASAAKEWKTREQPDLVSRSFRGRSDEADVKLPSKARGLMLGRYPVLACELDLTSREALESNLRSAHNQMLIARSYLSNLQIIDAHIFFVAGEPRFGADWKQDIDLIERNENVCRKLVWMPDANDIVTSFDCLIDRSFLAQPWQDVAQRNDAPLDQNERLVEDVLHATGLSNKAAAAWVAIARSLHDDPDEVVDRLVAVMETDA